MTYTAQSILNLINSCSSLNPEGRTTVDYCLYQIRYICAQNSNHPYYAKLFDRIVAVQNGSRGPVTEAGIKLMANVRDLELATVLP